MQLYLTFVIRLFKFFKQNFVSNFQHSFLFLSKHIVTEFSGFKLILFAINCISNLALANIYKSYSYLKTFLFKLNFVALLAFFIPTFSSAKCFLTNSLFSKTSTPPLKYPGRIFSKSFKVFFISSTIPTM